MERTIDNPIDVGRTKYQTPLGFMQVGDRWVIESVPYNTVSGIIRRIHDSTDRHFVVITSRDKSKRIVVRVE